MHYYFPNEFFVNAPSIPHATELSDLDRIWLSKTYPKDGVEIPEPSEPEKPGVTKPTLALNIENLPWDTVIVILSVLITIFLWSFFARK